MCLHHDDVKVFKINDKIILISLIISCFLCCCCLLSVTWKFSSNSRDKILHILSFFDFTNLENWYGNIKYASQLTSTSGWSRSQATISSALGSSESSPSSFRANSTRDLWKPISTICCTMGDGTEAAWFRLLFPDPLIFFEWRLGWRCGRGLSTIVMFSDGLVSKELELSDVVGTGGSVERLASLARNWQVERAAA